jgi:hypothetical protein
MLPEEIQNAPAEETQQEEPKEEEATPTGEGTSELEKLKEEVNFYKGLKAKWKRKYFEVKENEESKEQPKEQQQQNFSSTQPDINALREQYENDPFAATLGFIDKASRHYTNQVTRKTQEDLKTVRKENRIKRQLRKSYKDFDEFEDRVDELMDQMSPEKRTYDMFEMAMKIAKTEKFEDLESIREEAIAKGKKEASKNTLEQAKEIHAQSMPRGAAPKTQRGSVTLSPDEEKMAARYGMTKEDYAKWKTNTQITQAEKARKG